MKFKVLVKPDDNIESWYWEERHGDYRAYCSENQMQIVRHDNGYLCSTVWNERIGEIINDIMRMYDKECKSRFPGKISILPTDYYILNKSDALATRAYVIIDM